MLTACRFSEFVTTVICHAVLILCLGSFLLEDMFEGSISKFAYCYGQDFLRQCSYCSRSIGIFLLGVAK